MKNNVSFNELLKNENWTKKTRSGYGESAKNDISINVVDYKNKKATYVGITFRNGISELITDTGYIQILFAYNRCFFRKSNSSDGYKVCKLPNAKNKYA